MSYGDSANRFQSWLHRRGLARRVNSSGSSGRWLSCQVDTALPLQWLARVATRWELRRKVRRERLGRWRWRWTFGRS